MLVVKAVDVELMIRTAVDSSETTEVFVWKTSRFLVLVAVSVFWAVKVCVKVVVTTRVRVSVLAIWVAVIRRVVVLRMINGLVVVEKTVLVLVTVIGSALFAKYLANMLYPGAASSQGQSARGRTS